MTCAVSLVGLSLAFQKRTVLHSINASFPSRALSVVVGRSGSGKTTLLRAINRLNEEFPDCVTTGKVYVDFGQGPQDIYASPDRGGMELCALRQRAGMLFQTPNCFPVSVFRNIAMPLALVAGVADSDLHEKVRAALELVGLWDVLKDRLHAPAERLSGGQQQRLCLARLLALQPSILLLDEPTASLDVHTAREIEALLQGLTEKYTIIMVSHSLSQARRMADQLLVCDQGKIVESFGNPAQLDDTALEELLR